MTQTLVLLPGLNNTHAVFDGVVRALPGGIAALALDNPALETVEAITQAHLAQLPERFWLAGFSFGGFVAINASRQLPTERVVVVAPAVGRLSSFRVDGPRGPWLLAQGDADEVIAPATVLDWAREQTPAPQIAVFPGVGHFFHGKLLELRGRVVSFAQKAESPAG